MTTCKPVLDKLKRKWNWRGHMQRKKIMPNKYSRTIKCKSKSVLLSLHKTTVRPHLEYCTPVRSPHYAGADPEFRRGRFVFPPFPSLLSLPSPPFPSPLPLPFPPLEVGPLKSS